MNKTLPLIFLLASLFLPFNISARESLKKAALFGNPQAQFELGSKYYHGAKEIPQDYQKAIRYLSKASEQGHKVATLLLSNIYLNGYGVEKNPAASFHLIHAAAWQGLPNAQAILGTYYCEGIGVPKNISQCCAWFDMAAAQGVEEAKKSLTEIRNKMTANEIAEATKISRDLWSKIVHQN